MPDRSILGCAPIDEQALVLRKALQRLIIATTLLAATCALAKNELSLADKQAVIAKIQALIATDYVIVDQVESINGALRALSAGGKYDDIVSPDEFADALTDDLVDMSGDKHYRVGYQPDLIASRRATEAAESDAASGDEGSEQSAIDWNKWYAGQNNFGVEKAEVLAGNVGYLKITFFQPLEWMKPAIDSAMLFLTNTDALIIDLTTNGGGYSPSDSYLGSFFFDDQPVLWSTSYYRPTDERSEDRTFAEVGAPRYLDRPVAILVSAETFSLGEQFAYSMKHFEKAVIVGQVTAGAANGISFSLVDDNFVIQIPAQRTLNPITKANFEGVGVQPDVAAAVEEALTVAHGYALEALIDSARDPRVVERYKEIRAQIASP